MDPKEKNIFDQLSEFEVQVPETYKEEVFNQLYPEKKKRRGFFLWFLLFSVLIISFVGIYVYQSQPSQKNNTQTKNQDVETNTSFQKSLSHQKNDTVSISSHNQSNETHTLDEEKKSSIVGQENHLQSQQQKQSVELKTNAIQHKKSSKDIQKSNINNSQSTFLREQNINTETHTDKLENKNSEKTELLSNLKKESTSSNTISQLDESKHENKELNLEIKEKVNSKEDSLLVDNEDLEDSKIDTKQDEDKKDTNKNSILKNIFLQGMVMGYYSPFVTDLKGEPWIELDPAKKSVDFYGYGAGLEVTLKNKLGIGFGYQFLEENYQYTQVKFNEVIIANPHDISPSSYFYINFNTEIDSLNFENVIGDVRIKRKFKGMYLQLQYPVIEKDKYSLQLRTSFSPLILDSEDIQYKIEGFNYENYGKSDENQILLQTQLNPVFHYKITQNVSLLLGPSVTWQTQWDKKYNYSQLHWGLWGGLIFRF